MPASQLLMKGPMVIIQRGANKWLRYGAVLLVVMFLFFGCDGDSDDNTNDPDPPADTTPQGDPSPPSEPDPPSDPPAPATTGKAVLGPLTLADVDLYRYDDLKTAIYSTTTTDSTELAEAGLFDIPESVLEDDVLYVVAVSGGTDIDADDDGVIDDTPTDNLGILHLPALGSQLKSGDFKANILTDIIYHKVSYLLLAQYTQDEILTEMRQYPDILLKEDVDGDGDRDLDDLLVWDPVTDKDKAARVWSFYQACVAAVHGNTVYAEELRSIQRGITGKGAGMGTIFNIAVAGDYAYTGDELGMTIIDISDPFNPDKIYGLPLWKKESYYRTAVSGDYAYVVDFLYGEFWIIDIQDPEKPSILCHTGFGEATDMAVSEDYLYMTLKEDGLRIINVSDPENPKSAGIIDTPGSALGVALYDKYALVADSGSGLQVIDMTDPKNPGISGWVDTPGTATSVAVSGHYAFVADGEYGLQIIDITDPKNPKVAESVDTPGDAVSVSVSGSIAAVADTAYGVQLINIDDPENPKLAGNNDTPGLAQDIVISGDYAFVAGRGLGMVVIDINNPKIHDHPAIVGRLSTPEEPYDMTLSNDYIYATYGESGLYIVDVSDPENPAISSSIMTPVSSWGVAASGTHAYVMDVRHGLQAIAVSDPEHPRIVGSIDTVMPEGMTLSGNSVYVVGETRLEVIDIEYPNKPFFAGSIDIPDTYRVEDVAVKGGYAYVAAMTGGLQVVDIDDPKNMSIAGAYDTSDYIYYVTLSDDYAWAIQGDSGLLVIDIANPAKPAEVGHIDLHGDVVISGDYAYLASSGKSLVVVDVSDPANLVQLCMFDTFEARYIAATPEYVYVATKRKGIFIYRAIPQN